MGRWIASLALMLCLGTSVSVLAWDTLWTEKEQRELAFEARAVLQDGTNVLLETISRVEGLKHDANFNALPVDKKATLNAWLQIFKDTRAALNANADIKTAYDWAP